MISFEELEKNYAQVRERVAEAAIRTGRAAEDVMLLPVTKTQDAEVLRMAYELGMRACGENRVQEILAKKPQLPEDLIFHLIGHLQKNKVRQILGEVSLIHSVDSFELAQVIEKEAVKKELEADILVEINAGGETSKFGTTLEQTEDLIRQIAQLPHVHVKGLMTVAPYVEDPEENRKVFRDMHHIFIDIQDKNINNVTMSVLSMGMTNDYEVAISEGANLVRVGTGIFGARQYTV
ncbi:MAG: YggS family pyridoxal phosphate-dependent enzyme [Clostridiales bacterium]|nr:YggS family pyridoxal phosphate-dependent enzyme [Clostridiales bacterium]